MRRSGIALVAIALAVVACSTRPATEAASPRPSLPSRSPAPATSPSPGATPPAPALSARGFPLGDLTVEGSGRQPMRLEVEIAETPERRALGLMGVAELGDDRGMVFLLPAPSTGAFWMKDTLIPLDIAFWDVDGRIVAMLQMEPCRVPDAQCPLYRPDRSYVGAVEVNLGLLGRRGVKVGDTVRLERR